MNQNGIVQSFIGCLVNIQSLFSRFDDKASSFDRQQFDIHVVTKDNKTVFGH